MNFTNALLHFAELQKNKHPTFQQLFKIIQQVISHAGDTSLHQKIAILVILTNLLFRTGSRILKETQALRYEICFKPFATNATNTKKKERTSKVKTRKQIGTNYKPSISVQKMLVSAISKTMNQLSNHPSSSKTPIRQRGDLQIKETPMIPPFDEVTISQINQSQSYFSRNTNDQAGQEKMQTYRKLLQNGDQRIEIANISVSKGRTSNKRTRRKQTNISIDNMINLRQIQENETTKSKVIVSNLTNHQFQQNKKYYENAGGVNDELIQRLAEKWKVKRTILINNSNIFENNLNNYGHGDDQYNMYQNSSIKFTVDEEDNPSITKQLHKKLRSSLEKQIGVKNQISFSEFCFRKNITNQIRGELFYQLLHMDVRLEQKTPSFFGEISIQIIQQL